MHVVLPFSKREKVKEREIVLKWCPSKRINVVLRPFGQTFVERLLPLPSGKGKDNYKPVCELAIGIE